MPSFLEDPKEGKWYNLSEFLPPRKDVFEPVSCLVAADFSMINNVGLDNGPRKQVEHLHFCFSLEQNECWWGDEIGEYICDFERVKYWQIMPIHPDLKPAPRQVSKDELPPF